MKALYLLLPTLLTAASITGPRTGYVLDPRSQSLRPLIGIPGAAFLGDPIPLPFPIAAAASTADFAIVAQPAGPAMLLQDLAAGSPQILQLTPSNQSIDAIYLHPTGTAAALLDRAHSQLQLISGLPQSPTLTQTIDLTNVDAIRAIAVNAAGTCALIAANDGLYATCPNLSQIAQGAPIAVAWWNKEQEPLVLDQSGKLTQANRLLAENIESPQALLTDEATQKIQILTLNSLITIGGPTVPLPIQPKNLTPLPDSRYLLNTPNNQTPLYLLDAKEPQTYFIPGGRDE